MTNLEVTLLLSMLSREELQRRADDVFPGFSAQHCQCSTADFVARLFGDLEHGTGTNARPAYFMANLDPAAASALKLGELQVMMTGQQESGSMSPLEVTPALKELASQQLEGWEQKVLSGSNAADRAALPLFKVALAMRFMYPHLLTHEPVRQSLGLLTRQAKNGSTAHFDLAAAINALFALALDNASEQQLQELQELQDAVLALWLFISPQVFAHLQLLRLFLLLLQWLEDEAAHLKKLEAAADRKSVKGRPSKGSKGQQDRAQSDLQEALSSFAAYETDSVKQQQLLQQFKEKLQQQPGSSNATKPTAEEEARLEAFFEHWCPTEAEMRIVAGVLGPQHALLLEQRPGDLVEVRVAWNSSPLDATHIVAPNANMAAFTHRIQHWIGSKPAVSAFNPAPPPTSPDMCLANVDMSMCGTCPVLVSGACGVAACGAQQGPQPEAGLRGAAAAGCCSRCAHPPARAPLLSGSGPRLHGGGG